MNDQEKILVVDDEEIVLRSVKKILTREGFQVDTAAEAGQGLEMAESNDYGLVIMDLMMPEMNGIELMHAMKEKGVQASFLMITGYPTIKTAIQALRLGAIDYIPKPFTRVEIMSPVNRAFRRKEATGAPEEEERPSADSGRVLPGSRFRLSGHSWAVYEQEGTMAVGVEASFLAGTGEIEEIEAPETNEMVEQGYPVIKLKTKDGSRHGVFAPFSGRAVEINKEVLDNPAHLDRDSWVLRIIPSNLKGEADVLSKNEG